MQKLRLDLDRLEVEAFATSIPVEEKGTVQGAASIIKGTCDISCVPSGCTFNCSSTC